MSKERVDYLKDIGEMWNNLYVSYQAALKEIEELKEALAKESVSV